jgi:hypothetical protein
MEGVKSACLCDSDICTPPPAAVCLCGSNSCRPPPSVVRLCGSTAVLLCQQLSACLPVTAVLLPQQLPTRAERRDEYDSSHLNLSFKTPSTYFCYIRLICLPGPPLPPLLYVSSVIVSLGLPSLSVQYDIYIYWILEP